MPSEARQIAINLDHVLYCSTSGSSTSRGTARSAPHRPCDRRPPGARRQPRPSRPRRVAPAGSIPWHCRRPILGQAALDSYPNPRGHAHARIEAPKTGVVEMRGIDSPPRDPAGTNAIRSGVASVGEAKTGDPRDQRTSGGFGGRHVLRARAGGRARKRRFWWLVGAAGAFVRGRRIPDPEEEDPGICAQAQPPRHARSITISPCLLATREARGSFVVPPPRLLVRLARSTVV